MHLAYSQYDWALKFIAEHLSLFRPHVSPMYCATTFLEHPPFHYFGMFAEIIYNEILFSYFQEMIVIEVVINIA